MKQADVLKTNWYIIKSLIYYYFIIYREAFVFIKQIISYKNCSVQCCYC